MIPKMTSTKVMPLRAYRKRQRSYIRVNGYQGRWGRGREPSRADGYPPEFEVSSGRVLTTLSRAQSQEEKRFLCVFVPLQLINRN